MQFRSITAATDIAGLIAKAEQFGQPWLVPMLRAARLGLVRLLMVPPGQRFPLSQLDMVRNPQPAIVVLGGDGMNAIGPEGFPQAIRAMRWAGFILLHGAGGEPWHYAMTVEAAMRWRRVLLVESRGDHLQAWLDLKQRVAPTTAGTSFRVPPGRPPHMGEMTPPPAGTVMQ